MERLLAYCLCPRCYRAVPVSAEEKYCPNDGTELLSACSRCRAPITSPYVRYCTHCGAPLANEEEGRTSPWIPPRMAGLP